MSNVTYVPLKLDRYFPCQGSLLISTVNLGMTGTGTHKEEKIIRKIESNAWSPQYIAEQQNGS